VHIGQQQIVSVFLSPLNANEIGSVFSFISLIDLNLDLARIHHVEQTR
jgi:hypothetical protein